MASLWWDWSEYTLSQAAQDIGDVKQAIAQGLPRLGYSGVALAADVHGVKGDFIVAVVYLLIGGRNFWQVIACGGNGGTQAEAQAEINEVKKMISQFKFL
jgi:hypothetical protein